jgi:hypothetical protein
MTQKSVDGEEWASGINEAKALKRFCIFGKSGFVLTVLNHTISATNTSALDPVVS